MGDSGNIANLSTKSGQAQSRHLYVIGASGTGKSTLLLNLILQDVANGRGLAVLDPHGDLVDEILRRCPEHRAKDVVLIDPADTEYSIGFNILTAHTELERTLLASDLVAVFRRLSTSWGDQMTSVLGNAILAFLENDRGGTLLDLRRFLVEPGFRKEILASVKDSEVVYYWEKEFTLLKGHPQAPILTRLDTFLRPKPIRYMVAQKESRLNLRGLMDEGKILLARLSQGAIGEENSYLLGTLLVSKFHQLAMSRQDIAAADRRPFFLYIDEFQNFVTPSLEAVLSGARKYRLGLVLAHQDLRQIQSRSPEVLSSVLANAGTRVTFRVGDHDAKTLAEGLSHFEPRDLQSLGIGEALARIEGAGRDFNLRTSLLPPISVDEGEARMAAIVASSRGAFARSRTEIEAMMRPDPKASSAEPVQSPRPTSVAKPATASVSAPAPAKQGAKLEVCTPAPAPTPGRGGAQHKYLQELIRRWAEANGWGATVEEGILDGLGSVDVLLKKGGHAVACEISITTTVEHELQNAQKCLAAGIGRVILVSPEPKTVAALTRALAETLPEPERSRVSCCTPEELFARLPKLEAEAAGQERTVRGFRVKVRVKKGQERQQTERQNAVSSVIAKAIRRMKGKK